MALILKILCTCAVFYECNGETTTVKMDPSMYEMVYQTCLDRAGYLPLDNNSFFRILEVSETGTVYLPCSFCGESNEESPWYWKWRPRSYNYSEEKEVQLGLAEDLQSNRIFMYPNHTLVVQNVTANDTGIYFCRSLTDEDSKEFQFSVDVVFAEVPLVEETKLSWHDYQYHHIATANKNIYSGNNTDVHKLLDKIHVKVHTEWDPWQSCDGCRSIRKRFAKCRLYLSLVSPLTDSEDRLDSNQKYLYHSEHPSCHSLLLSADLPQISSFVKQVPNFLRTQTCYDSCVSDKKRPNQAKYRSDIQLQVGSSMSFICPGADLKSSVFWKKNGINIKPIRSYSEKKQKKMRFLRNPFKRRPKSGHVFVDRFSVLQLCDVADDDTGVYECYVDSKLMKAFNITVVIGEHTERERYYQYLMLSIYTSAISGIMVFLGIAWAYYKKAEFPTVEEIEAAERKNKALRDGIPPIEDDADAPDSARASGVSKRRFSLIGQRTSKHEEHRVSLKDSITFNGTKHVQKKRQSKTENYTPSEKRPLI